MHNKKLRKENVGRENEGATFCLCSKGAKKGRKDPTFWRMKALLGHCCS